MIGGGKRSTLLPNAARSFSIAKNAAAPGYWSSAAITDSPTGAWFVSFNCGNELNGFKTINDQCGRPEADGRAL